LPRIAVVAATTHGREERVILVGDATGAQPYEMGWFTMKAHVGDRLVLEGTHVGDHRRVGVIMEVRSEDGAPPYVVHWLDDDHEAFVFPGADSRVEPETRAGAKRSRTS
jgi:hypothetical protein